MSGIVELESTAYLDASSGRPEFQIRMKRGWGATRAYHVVGLKKGLLMLNLGVPGSNSQFDGKLGLAGGALGGGIGRLVGQAIERASESTMYEADNNFTRCTDAQLVQKAREYKGSLVADYEEIISAVISKPGFMQAWTRGGSVAALIEVREETLGKMVWEVCDHQSLQTATEFLPAKLGDCVQVNI